jgi:hypothetical protein
MEMDDPTQPEIESMYKPGEGPREGETPQIDLTIITASEVENEFKKIPGFDFLAHGDIYNDAKDEAAFVDYCLGQFDLENANRHAKRYIELINQAREVS